MERFSESDCSACGLPVPVDLMPDGDLVRYADAQATVEAAISDRDKQQDISKALYQQVEALTKERDKAVMRCAHLDVLLRDEYLPKLDVQAVERSIADRDHRIDKLEREIDRLDDMVEALQRERDHAKKMEAVQKEVADNQTWHVRELQDWRDQVTLALQREGGARFEDVPGYVKALVSALDAEREKVKGLEDEGVKLFEWRLALHSLTPGGSEFCTPDACEQWVRKNRTNQHEYIIEQIKQRKGLQTELTQLQALVRAAVERWRAQTNVKEGISFRMAMKELEATLDATTPEEAT